VVAAGAPPSSRQKQIPSGTSAESSPQAPTQPDAGRARQMGHARNQVGTNTAAAGLAARGGKQVGRCTKGCGSKAARPTFDAARHAVEGRPPIPASGHDPSSARAAVTEVDPGVRRAATVGRFWVIHFSIQQNHGHFIVEGDEARRARGGMHGLAIRLALAVNRVLGRKGRSSAIATTCVRSRHRGRCGPAWSTCWLNLRKHLRAPAGVDPRSSGPHFPGWHRAPGAAIGSAATVAPTTWMATVGWQRAGGPLNPEEHPSASRHPPFPHRT
jgi:hypothetical protein